MKKLMMFMVSIMAFNLFADTEVVDGIEWKYSLNNGEATVGLGDSFYTAVPKTTGGAIKIPSRLGNCPVTKIGSEAFYDCSGLTSVTIPDSVTSIGIAAFYNCSKLTSVTIGRGVTTIGNYAFDGCPNIVTATVPGWLCGIPKAKLEKVVITEGTASIATNAFYNCTNLTSVTIQDGVTNIGYRAFSGCSKLTSVNIPDSVVSIGYDAFSGCRELTSVTIPSSVTTIGNYAFYGCCGLDAVTIPSSVTNVGDRVFYGCTNIVSATVPGKLCGIPNLKLANIIISDGTVSVDSGAFGGCTCVRSILIPKSVTNIGGGAFYGCTNLRIDVAKDNPEYTSVDGVLFNKNKTELLAWPSASGDVVVSNGVKSIGRSAFMDCAGLNSVVMPKGVTTIGTYAFFNCSQLTAIKWRGDCPRTVGGNVFYRASPTNYVKYGAYGWGGSLGDCPVIKTANEVVLIANGGVGETVRTPMEFEPTTTLPLCTFSRKYYDFQGWSTSSSSKTVQYVDGETIPDLSLTERWFVGLYAVWKLLEVPAPVVETVEDSAIVELKCDLKEAAIYYTTNGATPKMSSAYLYTKPFIVGDSVNIKAIAVCEDMKSEYMKETISKKPLTLAKAVGLCEESGVTITTGGALAWSPTVEEDAGDDIVCARSGEIGDENETWMEASFKGAGTFTFKWKCDCEHDEDGVFTWDWLSYSVDGEERERIDGQTGWTQKTVVFTAGGAHTVRWIYSKDADSASGKDCGWVDDVSWEPSSPAIPTIGEGQGTVEMVDGNAVITPAEGVKAISVTIPDGFKGKIVIPSTVETVSGAAANQVVVMGGDYDITQYLNITEAGGVVSIGEVKSEVMTDEVKAEFAANALDAKSEKVAITEPIAGLVYTIAEGENLSAMADGDSKRADDSGVLELNKTNFDDSGFYQLKIGK